MEYKSQFDLFPGYQPMQLLALRLALARVRHSVIPGARHDHAKTAEHVDEIATEIHHRNVSAGWWSDLATGERIARNTGELLMLAVSELAEIPAGFPFCDTMDDKLPNRLMAEVEVADFAIRLFDTARGTGIRQIGSHFVTASEGYDFAIVNLEAKRFPDLWLMNMIRTVATAMEADRKGRRAVYCESIAKALFQAFRFADAHSLNIADAIFEKMEYNAQRADHKPENRTKADGKKY